jgi:hypothetical protein
VRVRAADAARQLLDDGCLSGRHRIFKAVFINMVKAPFDPTDPVLPAAGTRHSPTGTGPIRSRFLRGCAKINLRVGSRAKTG